MIVDLNGHSLHEARSAAARFIERTTARKFVRPPHVAKLERARTRILRGGTVRMRAGILDALKTMRSDVLARAHIREASVNDLINRVLNAIEFLTPQALVAAIAEIQNELVQSGLESASTEVGFTWDQPPQQAIDALYASTLAFARNVVDREKIAIKDALLSGIEQGDSIPEIAARVRDVFEDGMHILGPGNNITRVIPEDSWAEMVARTESTRAMTAGIMATYSLAGVKQVQWLAAEDEATCVECSDADGETTSMGSLFDGVDVDSPPAHPNCRCVVVSVQDGAAAA